MYTLKYIKDFKINITTSYTEFVYKIVIYIYIYIDGFLVNAKRPSIEKLKKKKKYSKTCEMRDRTVICVLLQLKFYHTFYITHFISHITSHFDNV
jgi:hypothetical protein